MAKTKRRLQFSGQTAVMMALLLNAVFADVWIIRHEFPSGPAVLGQSTSASCPQSCLDRINQAAGYTKAKESFVPLGSGTGSDNEWTDVSGAQSYVDSTAYGTIKSASFEVTVTVPTGNQTVWVRLFNATDKHPVWFSDVEMEGSGPTLLISKPITLDRGNKLYVVQMKTQLKAAANITQSRIRIITQ